MLFGPFRFSVGKTSLGRFLKFFIILANREYQPMFTPMLTRMAILCCLILITWPVDSFGQEPPGNPKNGKILFETHCANCHGVKGTGDGPDTQFLMVRPANFHSLHSRSKTDWELMNIITFGAAFSPMHGWSNRLSEDERWDVLRYIRLLAPFNPIARLHIDSKGYG